MSLAVSVGGSRENATFVVTRTDPAWAGVHHIKLPSTPKASARPNNGLFIRVPSGEGWRHQNARCRGATISDLNCKSIGYNPRINKIYIFYFSDLLESSHLRLDCIDYRD